MKVRAVRRTLAVGTAALAVALTSLAALPAEAAPARKHVVILQDGADPVKVAADAGVQTEQVYTEAVDGFSALLTDAQAKKLRADSRVTSAAPTRIVARIPRGRGAGPEYEPVEQPTPQYESNEISRVGALASPTARIDGRGKPLDVDIAVLDTGVDPYHPDLRVAGGVDCVSRRSSPEWGWYDHEGHGTFVSGQAAALDNGLGVVGVAHGARIWSVRVASPDGLVTDEALLCGLEWVQRNRKRIEVANLSLGGEDPAYRGNCGRQRLTPGLPFFVVIDPAHAAVCSIVKAGVTVVVGAGNDSSGSATFTPAAYPEVIAVSAMADFDGVPGGLTPSRTSADSGLSTRPCQTTGSHSSPITEPTSTSRPRGSATRPPSPAAFTPSETAQVTPPPSSRARRRW